ncbi:DUF4402 domain-containing protein [Salinimicrobium catena]|uniref:DUF4402 domain-containing protein n=1 Tax=Salinimicrobium catena TaxID=390640 RepID=UPI002FE4C99F
MRSLHLLILILVSSAAFGQTQATATFTASVTIIEPIGITNTAEMNFAALDAKSGGSVILTPDNDRLASGGVELADGTNVSAASFRVTGQQGFSFAISLPQGEYHLTNGSQNIILKDFTTNLDGSGNFSGGTAEFRVGATVEIEPGQQPGTYNSIGELPVTVHYN